LLAIQNNVNAFQFVKQSLRTEDVCVYFVRKSGLDIALLEPTNLTDKVCLEAVQQNGLALQYIHKSFWTLELCFAAIKSNEAAADLITTKDLIQYVLANKFA
jgi:hypothetical protein